MDAYSPLKAAASGLRLLIQKPWIVIGWFVVVFPFAAAATVMAVAIRSGFFGAERLYDAVLIGLLVLIIPLGVLDGAAYRSVTKPESSGLFYLRAGMGVFGRMSLRNTGLPGRTPVSGRFMFWSHVVGVIGLYVAYRLPAPYSLWLGGLSLALLLPSFLLTFVRTSLAGPGAMAAGPWNTTTRSWLMTRGHEGALIVMLALVYAAWIGLSVAIAYGAAAILGVSSDPSLWSALWTSVPQVIALDWHVALSRPVLVIAGAVALIAVLREVICERALVETYLALRAQQPDHLTGPAAIASS